MAASISQPAAAPAGNPEAGRSWPWLALLAAPFLICLAVLLITGRTFPTFWGGDELGHWELIKWFAAGLPRFRAAYPPVTATTPLFHLLWACLVRAFGPHLQLARAGNVLLSIGGVAVLFRTLRRSFGHDGPTAALLCAVFLSSSYYFGYAFRLLTDNMAVVGCLLAMEQLFRFVSPAGPRRLTHFLLGCLWCGLTILTRQSYLILCLPFGLALVASPLGAKQKWIGIAALGLALLPFAAFVVAWHGLVPPGLQERYPAARLHLYTLTLPVMVLGLYAPFFLGPMLWRRFQAGTLAPRWWLWPTAAGVVALVVLVCYPLMPVQGHGELTPYFPAQIMDNWSLGFSGWIYSVADRSGPLTFFHNSFLFWLALPVGAASAASLVSGVGRAEDPRTRVSALFLLGVLASSLLNAVACQKYYDGLVLLFLVWQSRGGAARDPWRRSLLCGLILVFCLYAVVYPRLARSETVVWDVPVLPPPP